MRRACFSALAAVCLGAWWGTAAEGQQPNIVLIMADDLGWSDTSNGLTNQGNPSDFFETPTLEQLASQGMAFNNAYTSGPNCAPTRAALLTGQYPQRTTNNVYLVGDLNRGGSGTLLVGPSQGLPNGQDELPGHAVTVAETLKTADYSTAHFGKYHVGGSQSGVNDPLSQGFDFNYGGGSAGGPGDYHANSSGQFGSNIGPELDAYGAPYTQQYINDNLVPFANGSNVQTLVGRNKHVSDAMADAAIDFMQGHANRPFFMQFNPFAVHSPIGDSQARPDLLAKYNAKHASNPSQIGDTNTSFAALIEGLDQSVARVIDHLTKTPDPRHADHMLSENTLVVFYSDNGGRQSQSNNGPLRGQKGELLEGGIRVPMIAWSEDASLVDGGTVNETLVASIDFHTTFAALAGVTPDAEPLDGESLVPILADGQADLGRENLFWHLPGYLIDSRNLRPASIVRSGDYKLWYKYEDQSFELYDLETDIGEAVNIAAHNPQRVSDLGTELIHWLDEMDSPLATLRSGTLDLTLNGLVYMNGEITMHVFEPITISAGEEVPFVGDFLSDADLDLNGLVDAADWNQFKSGQGADLSGLSVLDAFQLGDLDHDLDNDVLDFILFQAAYDAFNGPGTFAQLPEPAGLWMLLFGVLPWWSYPRRSRP